MEVKIKVPSGLEDIKLSQYQKFVRTTKDSEDVNFINKQIVGIFCNLSDDLVNNIKARDFKGLVTHISNILNQKHKLIERFKYNGKEYGFIPKLDDITVGEKADIDSYINETSKADKLMGVLYRPVKYKKKESYLIEDYKPDVSLDVTLDVYFGAVLFFCNLMSDLLICTQNFIQSQVEENPNLQKTLEINGVGIKTFMHSLEEVFFDFRTQLN